MLDVVSRLFEDEGRQIPGWQLAFRQKKYEGYFEYYEEYNTKLRRHMYIARLRDTVNGDVIEPLYDAKLLICKGGKGRVTGFETVQPFNKMVMQTWSIRFAGCQEIEECEPCIPGM